MIKKKKAPSPTESTAKALQTRIRNANSGKSDPMHKGILRLLVCGSRDWSQEKVGIIRDHILNTIQTHAYGNLANVLVITGSTEEEDNGVDSIVDALCRKELGVACAIFRAPWEQHRRDFGNPKPAGPKRNAWMLRWGQPTRVLAFHPYLLNSKGTKNMCEQARRAGIPVRVVEK